MERQVGTTTTGRHHRETGPDHPERTFIDTAVMPAAERAAPKASETTMNDPSETATNNVVKETSSLNVESEPRADTASATRINRINHYESRTIQMVDNNDATTTTSRDDKVNGQLESSKRVQEPEAHLTGTRTGEGDPPSSSTSLHARSTRLDTNPPARLPDNGSGHNNDEHATLDEPRGPLVSEAADVGSERTKTATSQKLPASSVASDSKNNNNNNQSHASPRPPPKEPALKPQPVGTADNSLSIAVAGDPPPPTTTAASLKSAPPPTDTEEETERLEERIRRERAPLEDVYSPYIVGSDTSLEDARHRLKVALDQTRQLRAAFTERVYGKYRVCLKPPPQTSQIVQAVQADPHGVFHKLEAEMQLITVEKEIEKRESSKLKSELSSVAKADASGANPLAALNADNADQLMYVTTGLNQIVLPEADATNVDLSVYQDRGPFHLETGSRVRGINQSSATAGGFVLDRCRQALALKNERDRRRRLQIDAGEDPDRTTDSSIQNYSRLSIISNIPISVAAGVSGTVVGSPHGFKLGLSIPPHTLKAAPGLAEVGLNVTTQAGGSQLLKTPPRNNSATSRVLTPKSQQAVNLANARVIRARVQANMSLNTLLSLNPVHEELRTDGRMSASTIAMMEGGVGAYFSASTKNAPQRYKHPFPDSIGGRRRDPLPSGMGGKITNAARASAQDPLQLPLLPYANERRKVRKIPVVQPENAARSKAMVAIRSILDQFGLEDSSLERPRKRRISEISLMKSLSFDSERDENVMTATSIVEASVPVPSTIDPMLALNVMKAIGLIKPSMSESKAGTNPFQSTIDDPLLDAAAMKKRGAAIDSGPFGKAIPNLKRLEGKFLASPILSVASLVGSQSNTEDGLSSQSPVQTPAMQIRGGGGDEKKPDSAVRIEDNEDSKMQASKPNPPLAGSQATAASHPVVWDDCSQQLFQAQLAQAQTAQLQGHLRNSENYHQANALQLAHQLRMSRLPQQHGHPQASDLAEYINGLNHSHQNQANQSAYDWNAAAALAMNPHHRNAMVPLAVQDHTRVFLAREQQNLAAQAAAAQHQHQQAVALMGGAAASHAYRAPGYATLGGHMMMGRPGIQQMPVAMQQAAVAQTQATVSAQPPGMGPLQPELEPTPMPDLEPTPLPDLEPTPMKETSVAKKVAPDTQQKTPLSQKPAASNQATEKSTSEDAASKKRKAGDDGPVEVGAGQSLEKKARMDKSSVAKELQSSKALSKNPTSPGVAEAEHALQFFVPPTPPGIAADVASFILSARCHEATASFGQSDNTAQGERLVEYMNALGAAVPIPKAMVMNLLKDRLNAPTFKSSGVGSIPALSRDIIVAVTLVWLWRNHESCFQRAFSKSGRIDVDPECKWLVHAAVDKSVAALSEEVTDAASRATSPLAVALLAHRNNNNGTQKGTPATNAADSLKATTTRLDLLAATIVSRALNAGFVLDEETNSVLPHFNDLLEYLEECRKCALYGRSAERVLLAALVARKSTMSFNFSHAYVSAIVRAGEALGHGELFEAVQNEKVHVSTMIPYDVFTDESGAWEDPCRPTIGYNEGLTGDEMMRRAHARAMIQKSLKKLQDRHNIKGGTPLAGPYADQPSSASSSSGRHTPSSTTPRGRRRASTSEPPIQPGTGSAAATSWSLYDPKHVSEPLERKSNDLETTPYGVFDTSTRPRSLSLAQGAALMRQQGRGSLSGKPMRRQSSGRIKSLEPQPPTLPSEMQQEEEPEGGLRRSTREIPWKDIAGIFQQVQLSGSTKEKKENTMSDNERTIFAPYVRKVDSIPSPANEEESDEEEDLSDETILSRHQVVLDHMKERLAVVLESRKRAAQEKKESRKSRERVR